MELMKLKPFERAFFQHLEEFLRIDLVLSCGVYCGV